MFRPLRADEIDVFPKMVKENGCLILLYKDARCDMNILDEIVGPYYWKREHSRDNANCTVSIYSKDLKEWISKEDTGTESNQDKSKGLASDSFKRACFNWGIGRELYTTPFVWIQLNTNEVYCTNPDEKTSWKRKFALDKKVKFKVSNILTEDGVIKQLELVDQNNKSRFTHNSNVPTKQVQPKQEEPKKTYNKPTTDTKKEYSADSIFTFGKNKDKKFGDVYKENPSYFEYLSKNSSDASLKEFSKNLYEHYLEEKNKVDGEFQKVISKEMKDLQNTIK